MIKITDDAPNINEIDIPIVEEIWGEKDTIDDWQPFRLNNNIIGFNNRFSIFEEWWKHPKFKLKNRFYWKNPMWK